MKSKEYQILTGQHRDKEFFSATKIQELPFISCCHQKYHLLKSVACNTMTYNFSAKEAKNSSEDKKMLTKSTRQCFPNTYPCILGRVFRPEECWKFQRLVKIVEYFAASPDYFRLSHWFGRHSDGILCAFISEGRILSKLERLDLTAYK